MIKEIPHQYSRSLGRTDFFQFFFHTAFNHIADTGQRFFYLCNHFHLGHRADAGQCLAPKSQGTQSLQIRCGAYFAGGMPQKCPGNLIFINACSVIGHPDQGYTPIPDFHSNGARPGIHGVFHQFLHCPGGPVHDLACCNFINGALVQNLNFHISLRSPPMTVLPSVFQLVL